MQVHPSGSQILSAVSDALKIHVPTFKSECSNNKRKPVVWRPFEAKEWLNDCQWCQLHTGFGDWACFSKENDEGWRKDHSTWTSGIVLSLQRALFNDDMVKSTSTDWAVGMADGEP